MSAQSIGHPLDQTACAAGPVFRMASLQQCRQSGLLRIMDLLPAEQERAARFLRPDDRDRFVLGRHLARSMLSEIHGIAGNGLPFEAGPYGKPFLKDRPDIAFSIAHSGDRVLVGLGRDMQLGVDVELHRDDADLAGISRLVFTSAERTTIFAGPDIRARFFQQWVFKEALVKALGSGLALEPRRFAIDPTVAPIAVRFEAASEDDVGQGWTLQAIDAGPGYSAAAAWRKARFSNPPGGAESSAYG